MSELLLDVVTNFDSHIKEYFYPQQIGYQLLGIVFNCYFDNMSLSDSLTCGRICGDSACDILWV